MVFHLKVGSLQGSRFLFYVHVMALAGVIIMILSVYELYEKTWMVDNDKNDNLCQMCYHCTRSWIIVGESAKTPSVAEKELGAADHHNSILLPSSPSSPHPMASSHMSTQQSPQWNPSARLFSCIKNHGNSGSRRNLKHDRRLRIRDYPQDLTSHWPFIIPSKLHTTRCRSLEVIVHEEKPLLALIGLPHASMKS